MNKRNSFLEFAVGALMGAVLIVAPAASGQNAATDTQSPQSSTSQDQTPANPQDTASPRSNSSQTQDQSTKLPQNQERTDPNNTDPNNKTPVQQAPSTQLPQDQQKDQEGAVKGDRAIPLPSSSDEDQIGLQPPNSKDNMNVKPQSDRDSSADPMAVRPQDRDQTAVPSATQPEKKDKDQVSSPSGTGSDQKAQPKNKSKKPKKENPDNETDQNPKTEQVPPQNPR